MESSILNSDSEDDDNNLLPVSNANASDNDNDSLEGSTSSQSESNNPLVFNRFSSEQSDHSDESKQMDLINDLSLWAFRNTLSRTAVT